MARIDVTTLVLAFEKRIEALEKNPPDKISTGVIIKMLESSIDDIIRDHFLQVAKKEIKELAMNELNGMYKNFISKTLDGILTASDFRQTLENKIKKQIIESIK